MKVRIKTFDNKPLFYETAWACAFDFKAKEEVIFEPWEFKLIDTWSVVETPKWYVLQVLPRSSTFKKFGLIQVNSVWIIDNDYCWNEDTIKFPFLNVSKEKVVIEAGTRIGQWVFVQVWIADFEVVDDLKNENRGGFGTTGVK
jgi:dUTP pyrophosphatase